jgi:hypothetical protein
VVVDVNPSMHADLPVISAAVTELFHKKARSGASAQRTRTRFVCLGALSRLLNAAARAPVAAAAAVLRQEHAAGCAAAVRRLWCARPLLLPAIGLSLSTTADAPPAAWDAARPVTDNDANRKCEDEGNPDLYTHQQARSRASAPAALLRFRARPLAFPSSQRQGRVCAC